MNDSDWLREPGDPKSDPRPVEELISSALSEPDEEHTYWDAVVALHWRGTREVFDRTSQLCQSLCPMERRLGADILGQLGCPDRSFPKECPQILLGMLEREEDHRVLDAILVALSHHRAPEAIGPASRFRHHADPEVRLGVVFALMGYENQEAHGVLIELTRDADAQVRDWATFALGTQCETDTPAIRDALADRLADTDDETRCEALVGLARRGGPTGTHSPSRRTRLPVGQYACDRGRRPDLRAAVDNRVDRTAGTLGWRQRYVGAGDPGVLAQPRFGHLRYLRRGWLTHKCKSRYPS